MTKIKKDNIGKIIKESENSNELKEILNQIEENYSIRITQYNKEIYKQGFIDGVNLMINCLK